MDWVKTHITYHISHNMRHITQIKIVATVAFFVLFLAVMPVFCQEIKAGEQFEMSVFLNAEEEPINAIEGKVVFSGDLLELKQIRDGNSIINFWVEKPKATGNQIIFSGIIPGGYQETNGFIFSAVFEAKKDGSSTIEIRDAKILLNDGKGTVAKTAQISILQNAIPKVEDADPPEDFKPEIAADPAIFNGKWFLVFATQDKISGIARYFIHESARKKEITRIDAKWVEAESPYVLKDQKLRSFVYVKAVDKAGNERIAVVKPKYPIRWYEMWWVWIIIILVIIFSFIVIKRNLWKKLLPHE